MGVFGNKVLLFHLVLEDLLAPTSSGVQMFCGGEARVDLTKSVV